MSGYYEGGYRQHQAEDVEVHVINTETIRVKAKDGIVNLEKADMTYAAWYTLLAAGPGAIVNILRRTS